MPEVASTTTPQRVRFPRGGNRPCAFPGCANRITDRNTTGLCGLHTHTTGLCECRACNPPKPPADERAVAADVELIRAAWLGASPEARTLFLQWAIGNARK